MSKFTDLNLQPAVQKALDELGFTTPTEIQAKSIPILKAATDFHGQAQTGTGKTLAFGIPLIEKIEKASLFAQAIIIAPTRELVVQIVDSLKAVSKYNNISVEPIYGGVSIIQQEKALKKGVHIVVGTPGRLLDHLRRGTLKLHQIKTLVLDEADVMLDMGFKEDIDALLKCMPESRNIWLFSATVKPGIDEIKRSHMKNPIAQVRVVSQQVTTQNTKQQYAIVPHKDRLAALSRFIDCTPAFYGIVFTPTKLLADQVSKALAKKGYEVDALHGDMSQLVRNRVIKKFKDKQINLLVATDVAARGIDVAGLTHVVNYALPREQENYVHRIGRTGRAGNEGTAITFISYSELNTLKRLAKKFKADIEPMELPSAKDVIDVRLQDTVEQLKKVCTTESSITSAVSKKLHPLLDAYSKEELINGMMHMLAPTFEEISISQDVTDDARPAREKRSRKEHDEECAPGMRELMLNVGTIDGISKNDVMKFLVTTEKMERKDIKKLRVIRKRSYVTVAEDRAEDIALLLHSKTLRGRKVQVRFVA